MQPQRLVVLILLIYAEYVEANASQNLLLFPKEDKWIYSDCLLLHIIKLNDQL